MGSDSTVVKRDAAVNLCLKKAGMLNFAIYDNVKADLPEVLQSMLEANDQNWELGWEDRNDNDGFLCRLYTPKGVKGTDPSSLCPPVLVFRGSDSKPEDFAELAFAVKFEGSLFIDKPWPASNITIGIPSVNTTFSNAPAYTGITMEAMDKEGLKKEPLISGASGVETIDITVDYWGDAEATLTWSLSAALYYGTKGDWAVNFAQGLGKKIPPQYIRAIKMATQAANDARDNWNSRLIVTGHSLGGGLASAACIAIKARHPDIILTADTFNAAGLHKKTANLAGGSLSTAAKIPIRARHVKDEILNSLQASSRMVPLLADFLTWGGKTMPAAVSNPTPAKGVSPGTMKLSDMSFDYAAMGKHLPVLYTIDRQTLSPGSMTVLAKIVGIANAANRPEEFVREIVRYLSSQILDAGPGSGKTKIEELQAVRSKFSIPKDQFLKAVINSKPAPSVNLGNSPYLNDTVEPFTNALIRDVVVLARILIASGIYHTFVPCAMTFLRDDTK